MVKKHVFLSYCHDNTAEVQRLHDDLIAEGESVWWDKDILPGENLEAAIRRAMKESYAVVLCLSKETAARTTTGIYPEARDAIEAYREYAPGSIFLIPVRLSECEIPDFEIDATTYLDGLKYEDLYPGSKRAAGLARLLQAIQASPHHPAAGPSRKTAAGAADPASANGVGLSPSAVAIAHLPVVPEHFLGRDAELSWLDARWAETETGVVSVVAFGGVGKSALVGSWVAGLVREGGRGARRVLGHSFCSQGSSEDAGASSDDFIQKALAFFGDPEPEAGLPWDKGERLAQLVRAEKTLLVLDGLEPLQHPPTSGDAGRLKDPALQALIKELAVSNPGLCIITTREKVTDIPNTPRFPLERLSDQAGAALLEALGVQGSQKDRELASHEVHGHGLTLTLLGTYLSRALDCDVRRRGEVELAEADKVKGGHAFKIMEKYVCWFGEGTEVAILRLLGLFNRPAEDDCIEALRAEPAIEGLTTPLVRLAATHWKLALSNLADCGLIAKQDPAQKDAPLDAHPLVREYFAKQLKAHLPEAAKEAHRRLYEHLKQAAPEFPDNLRDMMPLYHAVAHGCTAGLHQAALDDVYDARIMQGDKFFARRKLGALGLSLGAVTSTFDKSWSQVNVNLSRRSEARVKLTAGFLLRALGRLEEGVAPLREALTIYIEDEENWEEAASCASTLGGLLLLQGEVAAAVRLGEQHVELADRGGECDGKAKRRTVLAAALHYAERLEPAKAAFREAEAMHKVRLPGFPLLLSTRGFRYCDLLLDDTRKGSLDDVRKTSLEVRKRMSQVLRFREYPGWRDEYDSSVGCALDHLMLGRAHLLEADLAMIDTAIGSDCQESTLESAEHEIRLGLEGLRQAGEQQHLCNGLLVRAVLRRVCGQFDAAASDLGEAESIAKRGSMLIFQVDTAVELCRLHLARSDRDAARVAVERAKALVKKTEQPYEPHVPTWEGWKPLEYEGVRYDNVFKKGEIVGYHRRNPEIEELEVVLGC